MNSSQQLANRLREVILNGKWIANTNLREQLTGLSWEAATKKVGSLNTIAALTFHIHYYVAGVLQVLEGGTLDIRDKYSFDMPPINSEEDWEALKNRLWEDAEKFALAIEQLSEAKLSEGFVKDQYGNYRRNIEAIIEHSYYHFGQIVIIRKLL